MTALSSIWKFLQDSYLYWHSVPFYKLPTPWEGELSSDLDRAAEGDLQALQKVESHFQHVEWPQDLPLCPARPCVKRIAPRVKGRKLDQINAFLSASLDRIPPNTRRIVDWCSGKSHLGRLAAKELNLPLLALEIDPELCRAGEEEARVAGVKATFKCVSVLSQEVPNLLQEGDFVIALHACGGLHAALIEAAAKRPIEGLALAPCCYNRPGNLLGKPLSNEGRALNFELCDTDLDLIHREDTVAHEREKRTCLKDRQTRLSFDAWQRAGRGNDKYYPVKAIPKEVLNLPFGERLEWLAQREGFQTENWPSKDAYEAIGVQNLKRIEMREVIRNKFRRALELACLFDRKAALEDAGYTVDLSLFCPSQITPRNALLFATH